MEMNSWEPSPGPVKCALALMKRCGETARLPAVPVGDATRKRIEGVLAGLKLLSEEEGVRGRSRSARAVIPGGAGSRTRRHLSRSGSHRMRATTARPDPSLATRSRGDKALSLATAQRASFRPE